MKGTWAPRARGLNMCGEAREPCGQVGVDGGCGGVSRGGLGRGIGRKVTTWYLTWRGQETGPGSGVPQGLPPSGGGGRGDWEGSSTWV